MQRHHETISILKDLIATANDGECAFRAAAQGVRPVELATTLACLADNCRQGARELQRCVVRLGGPVVFDRAAAGLWRRAALSMCRRLCGNDDLALLTTCERVEERAVLSYRKALEKSLPAVVQVILERHYRGARLNHIRVRNLLAAHQATGPMSYAGAANIVVLRKRSPG